MLHYYVYVSDDGFVRLPERDVPLLPQWHEAVASPQPALVSSYTAECSFTTRVYWLRLLASPVPLTPDRVLALAQEAIAPRECAHGNTHYCGLCDAEQAPKCKHGHPWFCGLCGSISR